MILAFLNREANDWHMEVVNMIAFHGHFPEHDECSECYQPPFYYVVGAGLLRLLHITGLGPGLVACQLLNVAAGAATLLLIWRALRKLPIDERWRRLAFALVAFNPPLLGINVQVTNDTFAILLGTVAFVLLMRWLFQRRGAVWLCLTVVLAGLTKGNGLVVFSLCLFIGGVTLVRGRLGRDRMASGERWRLVRGLTLLSILFLSLVPFLGPYAHHYRKFGSPFITNSYRQAPPHWFEETVGLRPGVKSIASAYFTFRIVDLLEKASVVTNEPAPYPPLRTSLWTVTYAMGSSNFFHLWPPTWVPPVNKYIWLERGIYLFGLVPLGGLLIGLAKIAVETVRGRVFRTVPLRLTWAAVWLAGFLAMLVKYTYDYRDFATMKAIFLFPAILPFTVLIAWGMTVLARRAVRWRGGAILLTLLQAGAVALILCDIGQTMILIGLLLRR